MVSSSGKRGPVLLVGRHVLGDDELALAAHEAADVHDRRAFRRLVVARPLHAAQLVELLVADAGEGRRQRGDLVHDLGRMRVVHRIAQRLARARCVTSQSAMPAMRRHHLAHALDAALGVGEGAVLLEERRARQEHVRVVRRLVQEQVLHDDAFHRAPAPPSRACVSGSDCSDVLALHVEALEACRRAPRRTCWECAGPARDRA